MWRRILTQIAQEIGKDGPRRVEVVVAELHRDVDQGGRDDGGIKAGEHESGQDARSKSAEKIAETFTIAAYIAVRTNFFTAERSDSGG